MREGSKNGNWKGGVSLDRTGYMRRYRQEHRGAINQIHKKHYEKNKDNILRRQQEYYQNHSEEHRAVVRNYYPKYYEENREAYLSRNRVRRARKRAAVGAHSIEEWERLKEQYNYTCLACGKSEPEIKLAEDHIVPLSKGGSDSINNIQPLCEHCNRVKQTQSWDYRPTLFFLLQ